MKKLPEILQGTIILLILLAAVPVNAEQSSDSEGNPHSIERADGPELTQAIGHYSRARALLIKAIREFDKGVRLADPSSLIDSKLWRATLVYRAEDLEKILSPQPRASESGVQFDGDSRLLGEAVP